MKRLLLILLLASPALGQNKLYLYPPTPRIPTGGIQSLSAVITGNADKRVTWTKTGSSCTSIIGSGLTVGIQTTGTGSCTITATMTADGTTAATSTITVEAVRPDLQASSTHPRLGLTAADVASLRTKVANAGNYAFNSGLMAYFTNRQTYFNANFCWATSGCGYVGPKLASPQTATAWAITGDGHVHFTVSGNTLPAGAGIIPSAFASGSCFNGNLYDLGGGTSSTIIEIYEPSCTGSHTETGTLTNVLSVEGWIDNTNTFTPGGGGPFDNDTQLYAWMALMDPTTGNRATWAAHAHDMSMWEMNEACYGAYSGSGACLARDYSNKSLPFVGSGFLQNNRSQTNTPPFIEAIDWNYASFTTGDKAIIAQMGHIWGAQQTGANPNDAVSGSNEFPTPVGTYNDPSIINTNVGDGSGGANNFAMTHWQAAELIGSLLDPADDPVVSSCAPTNTTICASDGSAKTVGAYAVMSVKAYLYRNNSTFEDASVVGAEYGIGTPYMVPDIANPQLNSLTTPGTGLMSGGFTSEGTGYGGLSMSMMFPVLYNLYLEGKLNPSTDPQAAFISSAYWDKLAISWVHQLYPDVSAGSGSYTQFGSDQSFNVFNNFPLNSMEVYDVNFGGGTYRLGLEKWYSYNVQYQGVSGFAFRFLNNGGTPQALSGPQYTQNTIAATSGTNDGDFSGSGAPTPNQYDPRSVSILPLEFENHSSLGGLYRYYGRTDWTTTANQFQFGCNTAVIDHAMPSCGRFDFLRHGEAIVTALGGSSNNTDGAQAPSHQNIPGYQWNPTFDCNSASVDLPLCTEGGMADQGYGAFSNTLLATSSNSAYYYGATDASGAYIVNFDNCVQCAASANVNLSQREVIWAKPDVIFVYDRAGTTSNSSFKTWNVNTQTVATVSGNLATMTSNTGQKEFITSLLPGTSSLVASTAPNQPSGSPVVGLLQDTATSTSSVRMLHALEGKNSGSASTTTQMNSTAGTAYQGGCVGTVCAMFPQTRGTFAGMTYAASGGTTHYVAGLTPLTSYGITGAGVPSSANTDSAGLLTFSATGTGNITIGSPAASGGAMFGGNTTLGGNVEVAQ